MKTQEGDLARSGDTLETSSREPEPSHDETNDPWKGDYAAWNVDNLDTEGVLHNEDSINCKLDDVEKFDGKFYRIAFSGMHCRMQNQLDGIYSQLDALAEKQVARVMKDRVDPRRCYMTWCMMCCEDIYKARMKIRELEAQRDEALVFLAIQEIYLNKVHQDVEKPDDVMKTIAKMAGSRLR